MSGVVDTVGDFVGSILGTKDEAPYPLPKPPKKTDEQVQQAQLNQRLAMRKKRGAGSTRLTGATGLLTAPPGGKKELLGE